MHKDDAALEDSVGKVNNEFVHRAAHKPSNNGREQNEPVADDPTAVSEELGKCEEFEVFSLERHASVVKFFRIIGRRRGEGLVDAGGQRMVVGHGDCDTRVRAGIFENQFDAHDLCFG